MKSFQCNKSGLKLHFLVDALYSGDNTVSGNVGKSAKHTKSAKTQKNALFDLDWLDLDWEFIYFTFMF